MLKKLTPFYLAFFLQIIPFIKKIIHATKFPVLNRGWAYITLSDKRRENSASSLIVACLNATGIAGRTLTYHSIASPGIPRCENIESLKIREIVLQYYFKERATYTLFYNSSSIIQNRKEWTM